MIPLPIRVGPAPVRWTRINTDRNACMALRRTRINTGDEVGLAQTSHNQRILKVIALGPA